MSKLWLKYENWSKQETEHHMYRYTPNLYRYMLAKNDQNLTCTGTYSRCTGTCHRKMPRMCVFVLFFHIFYTQFSSILHIHLKTIYYESCNLFSIQFLFQYLSLLQKSFLNLSQTTLIWLMTHTQTKHKG